MNELYWEDSLWIIGVFGKKSFYAPTPTPIPRSGGRYNEHLLVGRSANFQVLNRSGSFTAFL